VRIETTLQEPHPVTLSNKVPAITLFFWVIKVLCTTVGETFADFLSETLGLGLSKTTWLMGGLLVVALLVDFRSKKYVPAVYWIAVVLLSIVGTLITDNLTDKLDVSLMTSTVAFGLILAATFGLWFAQERTLSVRSINTRRREIYYWLAILFTFALGTAAGDLIAERWQVGYLWSAVLFATLIAVVAVSHYRFRLNGIAAFWIAYVLTRPLGASIGDLLSQPRTAGGVGLGTVITSGLFLSAILTLVIYLTVTRKDAIEDEATA